MAASPNFNRTRLACYAAYFTMSSIFSLPPLLFVTLRDTYHISYTLLGTLVLANFCTQLLVDLLFVSFSKHFNVRRIVRVMPLITSAGWLIYALVPTFCPDLAYPGLLLGTVVFSVASGLSEVLLSPIIAAIPSDNPQRDMSMLHSLYALGVFSVVIASTLFFRLFGTENWMFLTLFFAALPIAASLLFMASPIPDVNDQDAPKTSGDARFRAVGMVFCTLCIFFGACAENAMSSWISGFMETALHIDKAWGDIVGLALFAILLWMVRVGYARFGKNIGRVLLVGMIGATLCYWIAGLASQPIVSLLACVFTGLFTSMLWPGTLILMEEKIPGVGVAAFALMAAGGDLGASVAPQTLGIVVDKVSTSSWAAELGQTLSLAPDQIGMKVGMLVTSLFPLLGAVILIFALRYFKKKSKA